MPSIKSPHGPRRCALPIQESGRRPGDAVRLIPRWRHRGDRRFRRYRFLPRTSPWRSKISFRKEAADAWPGRLRATLNTLVYAARAG